MDDSLYETGLWEIIYCSCFNHLGGDISLYEFNTKQSFLTGKSYRVYVGHSIAGCVAGKSLWESFLG